MAEQTTFFAIRHTADTFCQPNKDFCFVLFFIPAQTQTLLAVWQRHEPRLRRPPPRLLAPDWTRSGCGSCGSRRWPTCSSSSSSAASELCAARTAGCGEGVAWWVQRCMHAGTNRQKNHRTTNERLIMADFSIFMGPLQTRMFTKQYTYNAIYLYK